MGAINLLARITIVYFCLSVSEYEMFQIPGEFESFTSTAEPKGKGAKNPPQKKTTLRALAIPGTFEMVTEETTLAMKGKKPLPKTTSAPMKPLDIPGTFEMITEETTSATPVPAMPGTFEMITEETTSATPVPAMPGTFEMITEETTSATPVPAMPGTFEMITEETTPPPPPTEPDIPGKFEMVTEERLMTPQEIPGTFEMITEETTSATPVPAMPGTFEMITEETTPPPPPTEPDIPGKFEMVTEERLMTPLEIPGTFEMITEEVTPPPPPTEPDIPGTFEMVTDGTTAMPGTFEMITTETPTTTTTTTTPKTELLIPGPIEAVTTETPTTTPKTELLIPGPIEAVTTETPTTTPKTELLIPGPIEAVTTETPTTTPKTELLIPGPIEAVTTETPTTTPKIELLIPGPIEAVTTETPTTTPKIELLIPGPIEAEPEMAELIPGPIEAEPEMAELIPGPIEAEPEMAELIPGPIGVVAAPPAPMGIILGTHEMVPDTTTSSTNAPTTNPGMPMAAAAAAVTTAVWTTTTTTTTTTAAPSVILSLQEMKVLFELLLTNYDTRARPRKNQEKSVKLYSKFVPKSIIRFDTQDQKFSVMGYFKVEWWDQLMRWNPDDHAGAKRIKVPAGEIWTPNLVIAKAFDGVNVIGQNKSDIVLVHYKGYVQWVPEGIYSFVCQVDIQFYPYDIQTCALTYFVSGETTDRVNHTYFGQVDTSEFVPNSEWKLISVESKMREKNNRTYIDIVFKIKRRGEFAIFTVIAPLLMLSFLNGCVFLVPVGSGEKGTFAITVFLAYGVFVTVVIDNLPHNSLNVSYFVLYITSLLGLSVILVVYTIVQAKMFMSIGSLQCKLGIPATWTSSVSPQAGTLVPDTSEKKPVFTWTALLKRLDTWMFVVFAAVVIGDTCLFMVVVEKNISLF